jgi:hypothetical protein
LYIVPLTLSFYRVVFCRILKPILKAVGSYKLQVSNFHDTKDVRIHHQTNRTHSWGKLWEIGRDICRTNLSYSPFARTLLVLRLVGELPGWLLQQTSETSTSVVPATSPFSPSPLSKYGTSRCLSFECTDVLSPPPPLQLPLCNDMFCHFCVYIRPKCYSRCQCITLCYYEVCMSDDLHSNYNNGFENFSLEPVGSCDWGVQIK